MANNEQTDLLKRGTQAWNAWRAEHTEASVDLSGGALRGLDLEGADLSGADLRGARMGGANLKRASFNGADLRGAYLRVAKFHRTDLSGADLRDVEGLTPEQINRTIRDSHTRLPVDLITEHEDGE